MNVTGNVWHEPSTASQPYRSRLNSYDEDELLFGLARALVASLWRRRLLIITMVVAGIAASWVALSTMPSTYIARAEVYFDFSRQSVVSDLPADAVAPSEAMLNTEMQILSARNLMSVVVEELNLTEDPEFNPWLDIVEDTEFNAEIVPTEDEIRTTTVSILLNQIEVSLVPNSYVFSITVETLSPEKSAMIANGVAELFIRERDKRRLDASEDAISWLERRAGSLRERVLESENRVAEERALATPGGQASLTSMAFQIASLREQLAETGANADRLEEAAGQIRNDWENGRMISAARLAMDEGNSLLADEIADAIDVSPESDRIQRLSPLVQEAQRQIAAAGADARSKAQNLQTEIDGLQNVYSTRTSEAQRLRDSEREAAASLAAYEAMLNRLKGRVAADSLDPFWPEAVVISSAVAPAYPASPDRELILALGGVGSLVLASGIALLLNALFPVIASAHDLERTTGIPVLAQVPLTSRGRLPKLQRQLRGGKPSPLAHGLRALRIAIALELRDTAPRILLLTSAEKSESALGYLLAQSFMQAGRKVLLIDADPATTVTSNRTPATGPGLNSILLGEVDPRDLIAQDEISGIDVLLAVTALRDDADLFAYGEAREILAKISLGYDVVIIGAPPVGTLPDARILALLADAVLVVVRRNSSRPSAVINALELLISGGASRVATVLLSQHGRQV